MRKLLLVAAVMLCASAAFAQQGVKGVGVNLLYGTEIERVGVGAKFQYGITDPIRAEASMNYFFENDDHYKAWEFNLNGHYLFDVMRDVKVYPLAGVVLANWKQDVPGADATTKLGINLGGGAELKVADSFSLNFECKYTLIDVNDQAVFLIGATYKF
ncbi:MAG: porin family protein [Muribaculaceae bacterium]|nr:porin family protein [Muribaculaceae bacterium]